MSGGGSGDAGLDVVGPVVAAVVGMFVLVWFALRVVWAIAEGVVWLAAVMVREARSWRGDAQEGVQ